MTATPLRGLEAPVSGGCRVLSRAEHDPAEDDEHQRLLGTMDGAVDLSSGSPELAAAAKAGDWADTWALAPGRANVVRALDLPPDAVVLEIGAGYGPVTRYLGEQCRVVDALEPDARRAAVARARTRDLDSVEVFVGTVPDVPPVPAYDVVVVIDAFEHAGGGGSDPEPYLSFLRSCHAVLRPGGTLVLATGNPLGVRYLSGAADEHTGRPFDPLEGYVLGSPARAFPRRTIEKLLEAAGFGAEVLATFPDHHLPRVIMSDALFGASAQLVEALPRFPSPDYRIPRLQLADEALTWRTLVATGVAEHFANSLLILAVKGAGPSLWDGERLAVMFNSERQPEFAVRSEVRSAGGALHIARSPLYPARAGADDHGPLRHTLATHEPIVAGRDLLQVLLDEPARRGELLRRWAELVPADEWAPVDLVPHNLVLTEDDVLVAIDQEWRLRGYDRTSLLVRGLFLSAVQMASRTRPERLQPHETVGALVAALAAESGIEVDDAAIDRFCACESDFQSRVNVTAGDQSARRAQSGDDLRAVLALTLAAVRGGDRFDVQWTRAVAEIDTLNAALNEQTATLERTIAEYQQAVDRGAEEAAELRARLPVARARRFLSGAARRIGLRRR